MQGFRQLNFFGVKYRQLALLIKRRLKSFIVFGSVPPQNCGGSSVVVFSSNHQSLVSDLFYSGSRNFTGTYLSSFF